MHSAIEAIATVPSYFEHYSSKGSRPDVALDVLEFDQPEAPAGIEVQELTFEDTGKFLAHIARETSRGP